jgi:IclR family pca regulon transcriptional regulator
MTVTIAVGTRFPAYATSMGRVLLASLPGRGLEEYLARVRLAPLTRRTITRAPALRAAVAEVRAQGWALVDQELEDGLRSLAAPIATAGGEVTAAINVSTHSSRVTLGTLRRSFLPQLLETAHRIEVELATLPAPGALPGR